jgi:hypothetical protein
MYVHARGATSHPESICYKTTEQTTDNGLPCVYVHSTALKSPVIQSRISSLHPQNTVKVHSLHVSLNCLMFSVCVVVCVIFPTNSNPLVHLIVNISPTPHQSRHTHAGIFSWPMGCSMTGDHNAPLNSFYVVKRR